MVTIGLVRTWEFVYPRAMSKSKPQKPKVRNEAYMRGMQELRKSNASGPHRPKTAYKRKPKHGDWQ